MQEIKDKLVRKEAQDRKEVLGHLVLRETLVLRDRPVELGLRAPKDCQELKEKQVYLESKAR